MASSYIPASLPREAILRAILDSPASVIVFAIDRDYRYLAFNQRHWQMMKNFWDADIQEGVCILDVVSRDDDRTRIKGHFDRVLAGEHLIITELFGASHLERKMFEKTFSPITVEGEVMGLSVFLRDVHESHSLLQERDAYRAQVDTLLKSDLQNRMSWDEHREALTGMAGGLSHEVNNLLVGMMHALDQARKELPRDSGLVDDLETSCARLTHLNRTLMAYAGRTKPRGRTLQVDALIRSFRDPMQELLPRRSVLSIESQAPQASINGDPLELERALIQIIKNAGQAQLGQPVQVQVKTSWRHFDSSPSRNDPLPAGNYVIVEISDDGPGIPSDIEKRVFDPFFTTRKASRGMGLSTVLGIARSHKGSADISLEKDRQCVSIYLPLQQSGPQDSSQQGASTQIRRVLVVDDDPVVRKVIARTLTRAGFQILEAEDGLEALEKLEEMNALPEAVVLDLVMPRLDGHETYSQLRAQSTTLPVLLTSGISQNDAAIAPYRADPKAAFMPKPFSPPQLVDALKQVLYPGAVT